jgi:uncharacterized membrane protein
MTQPRFFQSLSVNPRWAMWVRPQLIFVVCAVVFGLSLVALTAPFQAPDEPQHFLRAYQISEGGVFPTYRHDRGGGELPASLSEVTRRFASIRFTYKAKTSLEKIREASRIPLKPRERQFTRLVTAIYSPVAYIPQATAFWIGRKFELPPLALMYMGRIANLFAWVAFGYAALRLAPTCRRPLLLLLLMPMSLFQAASLSADATTNGLAVLFAAMVLRGMVGSPGRESSCDASAVPRYSSWGLLSWVAAFAIVTAALSLTKFAYFPLLAFLLLIPPARAGGTKNYVLSLGVIAGVNLAVLLAWGSQSHGLNTALRDDADVSARRQVQYLRAHPAALITVPASTFLRDGWRVFRSFVGRLGSMDTPMSVFFILGYVAAIVLACGLQSDRPSLPPPLILAAVILIPVVLSVACITLLNYIYWAPVGSRFIEGMQGRYFLPFAPAIVILIWALTRKLASHPWAQIPEQKLNLAAAVVVLIGCSYTVIVVYFRYYALHSLARP